jgi:hypothetical protein
MLPRRNKKLAGPCLTQARGFAVMGTLIGAVPIMILKLARPGVPGAPLKPPLLEWVVLIVNNYVLHIPV